MIARKFLIGSEGGAYIAGTGDGIVTVAGKPASREIFVLNAATLAFVSRSISWANGNYMIIGLDPNCTYMVVARDYKKEYEPFAWDYVKPADDLTVTEQQTLWQSWQAK